VTKTEAYLGGAPKDALYGALHCRGSTFMGLSYKDPLLELHVVLRSIELRAIELRAI